MRKSNLVIGANSFLGQELILQELQLGNRVTGIFNKNKNNLHQKTDYISINDVFTINYSVAVIYFVSAYIPSGKVVEQKLFDTNVRLLEKIIAFFPECKIVLASSVSVYHISKNTIKENSITSPINTYGLSKLWAEFLLKKHPQFAIVRISSMFGVDMNLNTFLPRIINTAIKVRTITLFGSGSRLQNYVHKSHVAKVMINAAYKKENGIYLAVSKKSISNIEIAEKIQKLDSFIKIEYQGEDVANSFKYDDIRTRKMLNLLHDVDLDFEIKKLWNWLKKS